MECGRPHPYNAINGSAVGHAAKLLRRTCAQGGDRHLAYGGLIDGDRLVGFVHEQKLGVHSVIRVDPDRFN